MMIKIHKSYRDVVAMCDKELIGKKFEQGKSQLDLKPSFYEGDELTKEKILELLQNMAKEDATFNIVGEKSISLALKTGIIEKNGVKHISGIPYALVLV